VILAILGIVSLAVSCDRFICRNTNPIFDKYPPESKAYKDELVRQLSMVDRSKLAYWMDRYDEDKYSKSIRARIQGDGLCAKIVLVIKEHQKGIEGLLEKKGMSYYGAGLLDLQFDIRQQNGETEFVFREVSGILD
jgi:hypothetical protein